jgi:hypothetical protein
MRHNLAGLRSDTLAHILACVGIASILRDDAKVGWNPLGLFPYIESELDAPVIDAALESGIKRMRDDAKRLYACYVKQKKTSIATSKSQGKKGRKTTDQDENVRGLDPAAVARLLDDPGTSKSLREMAVCMVALTTTDAGLTRKPRSMLGKTLLYQTAAEDFVKYEAMDGRLGILEELASSKRMAGWIGNPRLSSAKGETGYDHIANMRNAGINQSEIGKCKYSNPIVEMLAIEGLRAFPVQPAMGRNPRARGMNQNDPLFWTFPIWRNPMSYLAIEDLLAMDDQRYGTVDDGIVEIRVFEIVENGNVQMIRPK